MSESDDSLLIFILSSLSNIFTTLIEVLIMTFWCFIMGVLMTIRNESRQEIDENVEMENEPPNKRRKIYDNSNETAPCQSSLIGAVRSFKLKEIVDKKVNDELADMKHVIFREGISDEKYQVLFQHFYNINRSFDNDILVFLYTDVIRLSIWS
jgi:hypothetical protein